MVARDGGERRESAVALDASCGHAGEEERFGFGLVLLEREGCLERGERTRQALRICGVQDSDRLARSHRISSVFEERDAGKVVDGIVVSIAPR